VPLVDEVEMLPTRVGANCDRRPHLAHQVRPVDGHGAPHPPALDHDLDRLPAERDLPAAVADGARERSISPCMPPTSSSSAMNGPRALALEELHQPADRCLLG